MLIRRTRFLLIILVTLVCLSTAFADEPLSLKNVKSPTANKKDEPLAKKYSLKSAVNFLDSSALTWQKKRKCFTCHTNYMYLIARPAIDHDELAHRQIRTALDNLVQKRWLDKGPRWDAEVVMSAAVLSLNDAATTTKLHSSTKAALTRMWKTQRDDGGWNWLKCGWPPMESDDHFGATMAAIAVGSAPEKYAQTKPAQAGMKLLRKYFKNNPPPTLHHRAMLLWAACGADGILADGIMNGEQKKKTIEDLFAKQHADGGWGLASLGNWKRADKKEQDTKSSDGYGTGFVIFILRKAGVAADDRRIKKGIAWLKSNQKQSGRWFTRSLNKDNKHYITHAGTAFAIMAIDLCESKANQAAK